MSNWMRKTLEQRDRLRNAQNLDADKQQSDHNAIGNKAQAYFDALVSSIDSDVGTYNAHSPHNELLNHLKDTATGSIGFCRAHPFPEAELWLQPRENGINCKIVIARTPESHHDVHHVFLEYAIDQNSELAVRHNGRVLSEDEVMELLLGRLVFPFGRLDPKS